ncbi:MAG: glycosyltransferase family 4 protein [Methylococcaceae bacterium]|nr:glycosyltransferase family 4 protein [Methylococcaceae bacterium]
MTENSRMRIAVVNSHPIQYFAPLYAYLNASEDLDVTALYCSDCSLRGDEDPGFKRSVKWDVDLLAGYKTVFLGDRAKLRSPRGFFSLIVPEVWGEVRSGKYDVLWLHGYQYVSHLIALLAAKTCGMPVMMRGETHLGLRRSPLRRFLRRLLVGPIYRSCDRLLAIGTANREFYLAMGVPEDKIFLVPYSVDNERFMRASGLDEAQRTAVRHGLGIPDGKPVILYASKFMKRKHPDDLLYAAAQLRKQGFEFALLMVGAGEMEAELRSLAVELELNDVVFPGFINQSELPRVYAASDVFVLPSEDEPWGLIVNETMCAGLPIVVADEVGCVPDLLRDGENGFHYRATDVDGLAKVLSRLLRDDRLRLEMGNASLRRISGWGYAECLKGIHAAVHEFRDRLASRTVSL